MTVKECYEKVGSDYDGVLKRLGSEALVKRFAVKFLNDPSFQDPDRSNSGTGCAELKGNLQLFAVTSG